MTTNVNKDKYSKSLANLFSTLTIVGLSILCLLNSLSIDFYSTFFLLKIVIPAAVCSWIIGSSIGKILESSSGTAPKMKEFKETTDNKAYEIPSMFSMDSAAVSDDGLGDIEI